MEGLSDVNDSTTMGLNSRALSDKGIIGIVVCVLVVLIVLVVVIVVCCIYRRSKHKAPIYASGNGMDPSQTGVIQGSNTVQHNRNSEKSNSKYTDISGWPLSKSGVAASETTSAVKNTLSSSHRKGMDNPAFCEDEAESVRPKTQSSQQAVISVSTLERRKNRMDSNLAAVIAAERDRNTSVFSIYDTDTLIDGDAVIVSDQRTAL